MWKCGRGNHRGKEAEEFEKKWKKAQKEAKHKEHEHPPGDPGGCFSNRFYLRVMVTLSIVPVNSLVALV